MTQIDPDKIYSGGARAVLALLNDAGYAAYVVGGAVRNALLDEIPSDIDIATDALPQRVTELAEAVGWKVIPTGIEHGTVSIKAKNEIIEVTSFRKDIATDGRRAVVEFGTSIEQDAERRDFTMNALYADADGAVLDPTGGIDDLMARRIRFIGDASARIAEDSLRILRFFRFQAWYGQADAGPDADGLAACAQNVELLQNLSRERVGQEMLKLLSAPNPAPAIGSMAATGALAQILPGSGVGVLAPLIHIEQSFGKIPSALRRLAALGGEDIGERFRLSKKQFKHLSTLKNEMSATTSPAELGFVFGAELAIDILMLRAAQFSEEFDPIKAKNAVFGSEQLFPLRAADLGKQYQGAQIGEALKAAKSRWIASGFTLTKEQLLL